MFVSFYFSKGPCPSDPGFFQKEARPLVEDRGLGIITSIFIPGDDGLSLIGDPDGFQISHIQFLLNQLIKGVRHDFLNVAPNFVGVVLQPPRLLGDLLMQAVVHCLDLPEPIKHHKLCSGSRLIYCAYELLAQFQLNAGEQIAEKKNKKKNQNV